MSGPPESFLDSADVVCRTEQACRKDNRSEDAFTRVHHGGLVQQEWKCNAGSAGRCRSTAKPK